MRGKEIQLKPCPFCGFEIRPNAQLWSGKNEFGYEVSCANCGATGPSSPEKEAAKHRWNNQQSGPIEPLLLKPGETIEALIPQVNIAENDIRNAAILLGRKGSVTYGEAIDVAQLLRVLYEEGKKAK